MSGLTKGKGEESTDPSVSQSSCLAPALATELALELAAELAADVALLETFYDWWFAHPQVWFQATLQDDEFLTLTFGKLITVDLRKNIAETFIWPLGADLGNVIQTQTPKLLLTMILVQDQLVRHVMRHRQRQNHVSTDYVSIDQIVGESRRISLYIAEHLISQKLDWQLSAEERFFVLMPWRHTFDLTLVERARFRVWEYMEAARVEMSYGCDRDKALALYQRFYHATLNSIATIKPRTIVPEAATHTLHREFLNEICSSLDMNPDHPAISDRLYSQDSSLDRNFFKSDLVDAVEDTLRCITTSEIVISLSGGVDSMSLCWILYHLLKKRNDKAAASASGASSTQSPIRLKAIHVNYHNRHETVTRYEDEIVKRWCAILGIDLYILHITELHRFDGEHDRDIYESVTKNMRYEMYRAHAGESPVTIKLEDGQSGMTPTQLTFSRASVVFLGHNFGDCLENIFTNVSQSRSYNNLKGMHRFTFEDSVTSPESNPESNPESSPPVIIVRPLLNITKSQIRVFARLNRIPHLPNSTPPECWRGRIRDQLVPFLGRFDDRMIPGFVRLSDEMEGLYRLANILISNFTSQMREEPELEETPESAPTENDSANDSENSRSHPLTISSNVDEAIKHSGLIFWKAVMGHVTKRLHLPTVSIKSLLNFIHRLTHQSYGCIQMNSTLNIEYTRSVPRGTVRGVDHLVFIRRD